MLFRLIYDLGQSYYRSIRSIFCNLNCSQSRDDEDVAYVIAAPNICTVDVNDDRFSMIHFVWLCSSLFMRLSYQVLIYLFKAVRIQNIEAYCEIIQACKIFLIELYAYHIINAVFYNKYGHYKNEFYSILIVIFGNRSFRNNVQSWNPVHVVTVHFARWKYRDVFGRRSTDKEERERKRESAALLADSSFRCR